MDFSTRWALTTIRKHEIPCIFPGDQGIYTGYGFATDCAIRHTVWRASLHYGEAMKSARGARFTRGRGRGERQRQGLSVKIA